MTHLFQPGAFNQAKEQSQFNPESLNFDPQIFADSTCEGVPSLESGDSREDAREDTVHVDQMTVH
jgi:hypothetical protein